MSSAIKYFSLSGKNAQGWGYGGGDALPRIAKVPSPNLISHFELGGYLDELLL